MRKSTILVMGLILLIGVSLIGCGWNSNGDSDDDGGALTLGEVQALLGGGGLQQSGIWVSGTGDVMVDPDLAIIQLGVEAQADTVAEAQSSAADAMNEVVAALTANGIADKDIQTQRYNISKMTEWVEYDKEPVTTGYRVTNIVTAKVRNVDNVGAVIDAVAQAGGDLTRIDSISFTVDEPEPYFDEAREEAIKEAMAKAEQMASAAGVTLGDLVYITESGGYLPKAYPMMSYGADAYYESGTPISTGELEISVSVQIGYEID